MLALERLSKTYADGTRALQDISLEIAPGEIVALIGGSGCGKTTLLRLLAGLDRASSGAIRLDGDEIREPHPAVGVIFQEPRLLPWLTIADNAGFGLDGATRAEKRDRVAHALEKVGLAEHAGRWPRELSGGQQQRVAIARALVTRPKVLLMDEPFSALDAFTRASLHEHLLGLWEETRPIVLIVTHDVAEAVTLADRAVVMRPKPGRIFDELSLRLSRPRDRASTIFEITSRRILGALDEARRPTPRERDADAAALWW